METNKYIIKHGASNRKKKRIQFRGLIRMRNCHRWCKKCKEKLRIVAYNREKETFYLSHYCHCLPPLGGTIVGGQFYVASVHKKETYQTKEAILDALGGLS